MNIIATITDADRYQFIKDNLTKCDPKMDGQHYYRIDHLKERGNSLDEVIDKLILKSNIRNDELYLEKHPYKKGGPYNPIENYKK